MKFFADTKIDFVTKRYPAMLASAVLIIIGIITIIINGGLNWGIDFKGGLLIELDLSPVYEDGKHITIDKVRHVLSSQNINAEIQTFGGEDFILIKTDRADINGQKVEEIIISTIEKNFPENTFSDNENSIKPKSDFRRRIEKVGPKIGEELKGKALLAILYSMLGIMFYIAWRFGKKGFTGFVVSVAILIIVELLRAIFAQYLGILIAVVFAGLIYMAWLFDLKYSVAAIFALIHDVLITIGVFSIFGKEISISIVAALLMIVGYSLNDTIVVFDRIREDLIIFKRQTFGNVINKSINETLSRTVITSLTTIVVVLSLFIFGGEVIRDFALALLIGVVVGTYSSIFIASPVLYEWQEKKMTNLNMKLNTK